MKGRSGMILTQVSSGSSSMGVMVWVGCGGVGRGGEGSQGGGVTERRAAMSGAKLQQQ